ncbi:MAG: prepilin-type N-terminal cleavage/methylation domain-containing protein [Polyangiales bacterium]
MTPALRMLDTAPPHGSPRCRGRSRAWRAGGAGRAAGMTLIEVMIVVVIMALAAGGATIALNSVTRAKLRSACVRTVAGARFAYHRSVVRGRTVRMVLDIDSGSLSFEEADGRVFLARTDDDTRVELDETDGDLAAVDPWSAAQARLVDTFTPSFGRSPFGPISNEDGEALARYQPQALGDNIRILRVMTPHEEEPREAGRASIYFFPGGRTQQAVIHLADSSDRVFSVVIHPLTGRGRIYNYAYEPEELSDEGPQEVRDPG